MWKCNDIVIWNMLETGSKQLVRGTGNELLHIAAEPLYGTPPLAWRSGNVVGLNQRG